MRYRQTITLHVYVDDSTFDVGWPSDLPWTEMLAKHLESKGLSTSHCEVDVDYERDEPEHVPYYVNVYGLDQAYGGPEEGGWWYSVGWPINDACCAEETWTRAELVAEKLREAYPTTDKRFSVLSGEDYAVYIETHPPEAWPTERPHYE